MLCRVGHSDTSLSTPSLPPCVCPHSPARAACLAAYRECLGWGLLNSPRLAATPAAVAAAPGAAPDGASSSEPPAASGTDEAAAYCRTLLQGTVIQHVLPAAVVPGPAGEAAGDTVAEVAQLLAQAAATVAAGKSETGGDGAEGAAAVALSCLSGAVGSFLAEALTAVAGTGAEGAADSGEAATQQLADLCNGVASLLGRLQRRAPACPQLAATAAAAAAQSLMAAGGLGGGLPPAASQLLATLLRGYGAATAPPSVASTLSRAPSGSLSVWTGGDGEASESAAAVTAAGGSVPSTPGATSVAASLMAGSSLSLDVLIRSYCNGPAEVRALGRDCGSIDNRWWGRRCHSRVWFVKSKNAHDSPAPFLACDKEIASVRIGHVLLLPRNRPQRRCAVARQQSSAGRRIHDRT